ncbi:hypothetical protein ABIB44_000209 [Hymenobacter sp. UYCo722]
MTGAPVPVYAYVPTEALAPYIVLSQVSTVPENGSMACRHWESVFQLTVLTEFPVAGQVSDLPALDIQGQVLAALDGQLLPLTNGFQMHPITIAQTRKLARYNQKTVEVLRYITVKMKVYQDK